MPFLYTERQLRNEAEQAAREMGITDKNQIDAFNNRGQTTFYNNPNASTLPKS